LLQDFFLLPYNLRFNLLFGWNWLFVNLFFYEFRSEEVILVGNGFVQLQSFLLGQEIWRTNFDGWRISNQAVLI
jgi:hypothetical protein